MPGIKKMTTEELGRLADVVSRMRRIEGIRVLVPSPLPDA